MEETVMFKTADKVVTKQKDWIIPGWLSVGSLTILAGDGGSGKSTISLDITAAITKGGELPGGYQAPLGRVVIWNGEDNVADTTNPRLLAAGADLSKVMYPMLVKSEWGKRSFDPANDIAALEASIRGIEDVRLIIIDPLISVTKGASNQKVREALQPLALMAERRNIAILGVTHLSKGSSKRPLNERITGSLAFAAVARTVMVALTTGDGQRILVRSKNNVGGTDGWFGYGIESATVNDTEGKPFATSQISWGDFKEGSYEHFLVQNCASDDEFPDALEMAKDFLLKFLQYGPRPVREIEYAVAEEQDFSWASVRRAQKLLGVKPRKVGGRWEWFPPKPRLIEGAQDLQGAHVN